VELCLHFSIRLNGVLLIKHKDNFTCVWSGFVPVASMKKSVTLEKQINLWSLVANCHSISLGGGRRNIGTNLGPP
jgi:hypothetical protein